MTFPRLAPLSLAATLLGVGLAAPASAQDGVRIELNKLADEGGACQAYLVLDTGAEAFESLSLDLVIFDPDGVIDGRVAVELGPLRADRTAVRAFPLPAPSCARVGRLLVNDVLSCRGGAGDRTDCLELIETTSRADVALID
ncbi:MAG: Tat pathway signal sequence domain protein [Pseudomonadota bacterium]